MSKNPATSTDGPPSLVINGALARIVLNRPREHNRLDPDDLSVLAEHLRATTADPLVRVLVITGSGDRTFSSGYTLQAIREQLDERFERLLDMLEELPLPTIAALNGSVYGGGTDLALACDFRIGVRGSRMFMPAAKFGLHYYPGGMRRYVTRLGLTAAKKLMLTAQTIEDEEMLRIGFLTERVDREDLDRAVMHYVDALMMCEPGVVAAMKRNLNRIAEGRLDAHALRDDYLTSLRSPALNERLDRLLGDK